MSEFDRDQYKNLKEEFIRVSKRIIKENLSTVPATLQKYRADIIIVHNALMSYIIHFYPKFDIPHKQQYKNELIYIRRKIIDCFEKLNIEYTFSKYLLSKIDLEETEGIDVANLTITDLDTIDEGSDNELFVDSTDNLNGNFGNNSGNTIENNFDMADDINKFVSLCASTLSKYSGDPLCLDSFINSIDFLEAIAGNNAQILVSFVKTRLEGKALEIIPKENVTLENIKASLKASIKPDNSKVVEGKILALRFNPTKASDFTTEATKLAEAFQRSLIIEGIPQSKAKAMAVEKTVDLCRKNAKSETVKAILASKDFSEPSDVIAKLIVEANQDYQEKQILKFRQQNNNRNRGRGGKNTNNWHNNKNKNGQWNNNNNNNSTNYRGHSKNYRGNRGNGRGGYGNNGNSQQYIRVATDQGNGQSPSTDRRAITYESQPVVYYPNN